MLALLLSLASPTFCQNAGEIFPDQYTRKKAQQVDLKAVKEVSLYLDDGRQQALVVTDPKTIALLVNGLKDATETGISNQLSGVEATDKNGKSLVSANFSLDFPSHALSPKFIEGLKAAGVEPRAWKEMEERRKAEELTKQRLFTFAPPLALVALIAFLVFKRQVRTKI